MQRFIYLICFLCSACANQVSNTHDDILAKRLALTIEYMKLNQPQLALHSLDIALTRAPDNLQTLLTAAFYFTHVGDELKAKYYYQHALRLYPNNAELNTNYAAYLCSVDINSGWRPRMFHALSIQNNRMAQSALYENIGLCEEKSGRTKAAIDAYSHALIIQPQRKTALLRLIALYKRSGEQKQMKRYLKQYRLYFAT